MDKRRKGDPTFVTCTFLKTCLVKTRVVDLHTGSV